jgi:integrase
VPDNYVRGSAVLIITDDIDKARFGRELPLTPPAREALESVCPDRGLIFGEHDYRDQLKKAAWTVLPPERAATFTAYDLRHARATQWAETGNLVGVAYLLGHKQVTTTDKYARPNRNAAEKVLLTIKDSARLRWNTVAVLRYAA